MRPELRRLRELHRPRPHELPTTVILSDEFEEFDLPDWYLGSIVRRPRTWKTMGGPHPGLLLPPTIDLVAQEIVAAVEKASASRC